MAIEEWFGDVDSTSNELEDWEGANLRLLAVFPPEEVEAIWIALRPDSEAEAEALIDQVVSEQDCTPEEAMRQLWALRGLEL